MAARGHSIRVVRTSIEAIVLVIGWILGGSVGIGTVLFALTIGPITHITIPALAIRPHRPPARATSFSAEDDGLPWNPVGSKLGE